MEAMNLANCVADEDGDQFNDENLETYDWYTYQISQDQANNADEVCQVVSGLNGEYSTLYDKSNGGSLYTYKKTKKSGMRPGGVATLVIFIILAAAAAAAFIVKKKKTSDKKTPLINESDGTLA